MKNPASVAVDLRRVTRSESGVLTVRNLPDEVAAEAPLTLRVEGRAVAVVMRTPGNDRELAAGFLLSEGVIRGAADVFEISLCPSVREGGAGGDSVDVVLSRPETYDPERLTRHVFTSSSCGICGKTDLVNTLTVNDRLSPEEGPVIAAEAVFGLPARLREAQAAFAATGGLHGCAWFALESPGTSETPATTGIPEVRPLLVFEDVGRHNALDKLLGSALLGGRLPLSQGVLLLSGRISFELVQKAAAARIPVIAAIGAPSSLAVEYAEAAGLTLCGFLKDGRMNVYTHPGRIGEQGSPSAPEEAVK